MEFVILVGVAFSVLLVFTAMVRDQTARFSNDKTFIVLKDVCYMAQTELYLASTVEDGYSRTFDIPNKLEGTNYTINITNNQLLCKNEDNDIGLNIPSVTGNIKKGHNHIRKINRKIYLN